MKLRDAGPRLDSRLASRPLPKEKHRMPYHQNPPIIREATG